jgi:hypothetical protein
MPKKIIQDIYTTNKRSIRMISKSDIRPEIQNKKKSTKTESVVCNKKDDLLSYQAEKINKSSQVFLWVISIFSVVVLIFLVSSIFATASLKITPRNEKVVLNDTFTMIKGSEKDDDSLNYEVMTIKKSLSKELKTDGEEYVEKKAVGKAVIYNNDSTSKQRLINNTRLETADGLIYRIRQSVDVPGYKVVGGVKTPGSVEVEIIADMPGDKYNMKLEDFKGDFTIPGFKGTTKFTTFYARLSSDTIGGFVGNVRKVSEENLKKGREELRNELKDTLMKDIYTQKPDQFMFFDNTFYINYSSLEDSINDEKYVVSEEATINVPIFKESEIFNFIATDKIVDFDSSPVSIIWSNVETKITGLTEKPWTEEKLKINFSGDVKVVWLYDVEKIINTIKGQNKNIIQGVLNDNKSSVLEIESSIRPQWKRVFPTNTHKIKILDTIMDKVKI